MATIETPEKGYAGARVKACENSTKQAFGRKARALLELAQAEKVVAAGRAKHDGAAQKYLDDPSDANKRLVHEARDDAHLLELALGKAQREVTSADDDIATAERALADATAEAEEEKRAARKAELSAGTKVDVFRTETSDDVRKILDGYRSIVEGTEGVGRKFSLFNQRTRELREVFGEPVTDLDHLHLVGGILAAHASAHPETIGALLQELNPIRHGVDPSRTSPAQKLRDALLSGFAFVDNLRRATAAADLPRLRAELEHHLLSRTPLEARGRIEDERYVRGDQSELLRRQRENLPPPAGVAPKHIHPAPPPRSMAIASAVPLEEPRALAVNHTTGETRLIP